jgi:predicted N-formylglutamate amidohydrolase
MLNAAPLLDPIVDPDPVELCNSGGQTPMLLVCEHAGQAVPQRLGGLGLNAGEIDLHIGWDVGAAAVTRKMAAMLDCPAVLQRYSRLVIDCNRPLGAIDSVLAMSDGVPVPVNLSLSAQDRRQREEAIFTPFDLAVTQARTARTRMILAIHSFTPRLAVTGIDRPWHLGFLFRKDSATSTKLAAAIAELRSDLIIGMNQPYKVEEASDWFVPRHGEGSGLPHSLIEIRHDLIRDAAGQHAMADLLSTAIRSCLETLC